MASTKYVCSQTCPTLFHPIFYKVEWVILHDITGFHLVIEQVYLLINRLDTRCGVVMDFQQKTQIFLVLYNHNTKRQLQGQGRILINTSDLDVNITANDISRMLTDDAE